MLAIIHGSWQDVIASCQSMLGMDESNPEKLRQEMASAGLRDIRIERANHSMAFHSGAHMWDTVSTSNPIGAMMVADMTDDQRAAVQRTLDAMLRERAGGNGPATLDATVNIAIGTAWRLPWRQPLGPTWLPTSRGTVEPSQELYPAPGRLGPRPSRHGRQDDSVALCVALST
ncbi:MAG TPA: hypothetical protein VMM78_17930 [Thermomicrobiales bacterium]|nr:hypothetical protein [Thermomicrobiales bacterium]